MTIEFQDGSWYIYTDETAEGCVGPFKTREAAHKYALKKDWL